MTWDPRKMKKYLYVFLGVLSLMSYTNCATSSGGSEQRTATCLEQFETTNEWSSELEVQVTGYSANAMEPQISADGAVLFFNDKPSSDTAMEIHFAVKQSNGTFAYGGLLAGANNSSVLDGVPALDSANNFYFVSLRNYGAGSPARYRTLFGSQLSTASGLSAINVAAADSSFADGPAPEGSKFYVDMDMGVSWDGTKAVVARAQFTSGQGYPDVSQLEMFNLNSTTRALSTDSNSTTQLQNVNVSNCLLYAPNLSDDKLELFYTALQANTSGSFDFKILVAERSSTALPFESGKIISGITGQAVEGPSITLHDSGKTLYYHKFDTVSSRFKIYSVSRP